MEKSLLFCRVSSKEQEETGYSLPAQEKFLKDYAERGNLRVAKVFAVSESASSKAQRKVFNEMLAFAKANSIPNIVVETTDRLTRNFSDVPKIDRWIKNSSRHRIHLAKEGCVLHEDSKSHEWFMWRVKVATAEYYIRLLSENVKKGQREKINQGWLPTRPPLGYKTVGEKGHKKHVVDEDKALLVKKMFALYSSGNYSIKRLTEKMYEEGLKNRNGRAVSKSRLHQLLTDPFYIGKNRWNNEISEGKQTPLIDRGTFDRVQSILKRKSSPKYQRHYYLFRGLIHCQGCGGLITWEKQKGVVYGHCNHYRDCAQKIWVKEPEVERQVVRCLKNLQIKSPRLTDWIRRALKEGHRDEIEYHTSSLKELNQQYERVQKRLDRLYDDRIDEKIPRDFYNRKFKQYSQEKEDVTEALQKHSQAGTQYIEMGVSIYDLSQRAKKTYSKAKINDKRGLLRMVFDELRLDEGKLKYHYSKAFQLLSESVKYTNSSKAAEIVEKQPEIFEPAGITATKVKDGELDSVCSDLLPGLDSNQQPYP